MTDKHTPGPYRWVTVDSRWSENPNDDGDYENIYYITECGPFDALWSDAAGRPVFFAEDASNYKARLEWFNEVDSALIKSAPDLLAALELFVLISTSLREVDPVIASKLASAYVMGKNAIAMARGEL